MAKSAYLINLALFTQKIMLSLLLTLKLNLSSTVLEFLFMKTQLEILDIRDIGQKTTKMEKVHSK